MWQNMNFNPSVAASPRIVETRRQQFMDHGVPARAPGPIGGVEARRTEGAAGRSEARCVERQPRGRAVVQRAPRLAEPPEFLGDRRPQGGAAELGGNAGVQPLAFQRRDGKGQPDRPAMQALQQPTMAVQERAELPPGRIGDDVDEDYVVARPEPDRELLGKVTNGPRAALIEDQRGQVVGGQLPPVDEVGDLLALGPQPRQLGRASTTSSTISRSSARASVAGRRCRLSGSPMAR